MKILVLHRVPFQKAKYNTWIDHSKNEVIYYGNEQNLRDIPSRINCKKVDIIGTNDQLVLWAIEQDIERIIALSEYDLLLAARLRQALSIPGDMPEQVLQVRDKVIMKQNIVAAGIRAPRYFRVSDYEYYKHQEWLDETLVLKPVDGASSENVQIMSHSELKRVLSTQKLNPQKYEVEEFIHGPIIHIDGWMNNGSLVHYIASEYVGTCLAFAEGQPLGSFQFEEKSSVENSMSEWTEASLKAVGIKDGAFHLEGIMSNNGPVFLEVGHRVGGAGVAETFEAKTGVSLYGIHIQSQLCMELNNFTVKPSEEFYSWFVFPGHHLESPYCTVDGLDNLKIYATILKWIIHSPEQRLRVHPKLTYNCLESPFAGGLSAKNPNDLRISLMKIFSSAIIGIDSPAKRMSN